MPVRGVVAFGPSQQAHHCANQRQIGAVMTLDGPIEAGDARNESAAFW